MFDMFGPRMPRSPEHWVKACTAWAGHSFRETKDGSRIYCVTCGAVVKVEEAGQ